jgi:hypothetical protein
MRSLYRAEKFIEKKGHICHSSTVTEIATNPSSLFSKLLGANHIAEIKRDPEF